MNIYAAAKLALEALEVEHSAIYGAEKTTQAITALKQAIEQQEKVEPVAWMSPGGGLFTLNRQDGDLVHTRPIYAHPAPAVEKEEINALRKERDELMDYIAKHNELVQKMTIELAEYQVKDRKVGAR